MSMPRLTLLALCAILTLSASAWATSSCMICDCNNTKAVCLMQCQQSYTDYAQRMNCEVSCAKTHVSCVDSAYQTTRSLEQSAQQSSSTSTTTTNSGSTSSGS